MYRLLQREVWLLLLLVLLAVPGFFLTRTFALQVRGIHSKEAATWYARGNMIQQAGNTREAIRYFRQAASADHESTVYSLALANGLAREGRNPEAQRLLLQLREDQPEDAAINLQLGRIAARDGDLPQAVLHYHHALYGRWAGEQAAARISVRKELIRLMLLHRDLEAATSELLILVQDTPHTVAEMTEAGQLFLAADDSQNALRQFENALKQQRDTATALAGAGEAEFRLGDYAAARRYLHKLPSNPPQAEKIRHMLMISDLVYANDPMLPRLTEGQRSQRLRVDFNAVRDHLNTCVPGHPDLNGLRNEAEGLNASWAERDVLHDPASIDATLVWIHRAEDAVIRQCGSSDLRQALLLLGRSSSGSKGE